MDRRRQDIAPSVNIVRQVVRAARYEGIPQDAQDPHPTLWRARVILKSRARSSQLLSDKCTLAAVKRNISYGAALF